MIHYKRGGIHFLLGVFQQNGSVFWFAALTAMFPALATLGLKILAEHRADIKASLAEDGSVMNDSNAWSNFTFLVGFLIIFRTSQAYNRFWEGCTAVYRMRAEWLDACSGIMAFCKIAKASPEKVSAFQQQLVRMFSMLNALALAEIEDSNSDGIEHINAFTFELIDLESVDDVSIEAVKTSDAKAELVFQWIQQFLVENIETGVLAIAPPILSRSFQQLANGMVMFHEAVKISTIPFPFPYAQTCDCLLLLHWLGTPFVICQWVETWWWACILSFVQVFILWTLNCIAVEIENPYGQDANDIDASRLQAEVNRFLQVLIEPSTLRTPSLKGNEAERGFKQKRMSTFMEVWRTSQGPSPPKSTIRRSLVAVGGLSSNGSTDATHLGKQGTSGDCRHTKMASLSTFSSLSSIRRGRSTRMEKNGSLRESEESAAVREEEDDEVTEQLSQLSQRTNKVSFCSSGTTRAQKLGEQEIHVEADVKNTGRTGLPEQRSGFPEQRAGFPEQQQQQQRERQPTQQQRDLRDSVQPIGVVPSLPTQPIQERSFEVT